MLLSLLAQYNALPSDMSASIQVISTNNYDGSALLVFSTETERIVFNCGEGTQRLCAEHKVRLQKVDRIFFTALHHETIFGLPGMSLTLADGGKKAFSFYGPPSMDRFWASTRRFMYRPDLSVSIHDATTMGPIGCKECTVHPIAFENKASTSISQRFYVSYVCETPPKAGKFDVAKASALGVPKGPLFAKLKSGEDVSLPDGSVVRSADVVEQADLGRFCAIVASIDFQGANAAALLEEFCGLPQWKRFQIGGSSFGLLDCMMHLSPSHVVQSPPYQLWMRSFGDSTTHVLLGRGAGQPVSAFQASTRHSRKLSKFEPRLFPSMPLRLSADCGVEASHEGLKDAIYEPGLAIKQGAPILKYTLVPKTQRGWTEGTCNSPSPLTDTDIDSEASDHFAAACSEEVLRLMDELNAVKESTKAIQNKYAMDLTASSNNDNPAAVLSRCSSNNIVFLGTGCAIPSKYRNVSATLIEATQGSILLDAGEGTWHQLIRSCAAASRDSSSSGFQESLVRMARNLRLLWISHPHADHHLGIVTIILERKRLLSSDSTSFAPLIVIAPPSILSFIKDYAELEPNLAGAYFGISTSKFDPWDEAYLWPEPDASEGADHQDHDGVDTPIETNERNKKIVDMLNAIGIDKLSNVKVYHCYQAFGVRIWSREGWSVVYSGDTRPCPELEELGRGATILIHEATFDDSKADEALQKKHSTQSEAVEVRKNMGAYRLLLTHFSQRYPNIPMTTHDVLSPSADAPIASQSEQPKRLDAIFNDKPVDPVFAFDCMRISFPDLLWAPAATAVLSAAFPQQDAEEEGEEAEDAAAESRSYAGSQCEMCLKCRSDASISSATASSVIAVCSPDAVVAAGVSSALSVRCPHVVTPDGSQTSRKKPKLV